MFCLLAFRDRSQHIGQAGLKLQLLLCLSPKGWDYRAAPPRPVLNSLVYNQNARSVKCYQINSSKDPASSGVELICTAMQCDSEVRGSPLA